MKPQSSIDSKQITIDDFSRVDLRVGRVVNVDDVAGSDKLYRMTVDLGEEYGRKTIYAGVKPWYEKSALKDKHFVFVANLAPRKMPGGESQGMMLAADCENTPILIPVSSKATPGTTLR